MENISNNILTQLMLDNSSEMVLVVNPQNLLVISANAAACKSLDYELDELIGRDVTEIESTIQDVFYWDEARQGIFQEIQSAEGLYRRRSGEVFVVEKSIRCTEANGQNLLILVARDYTQRKQIEDELAQSTSLLRATLESTADGILVTELDGRISNMNRHFARLWGIPDELLDQDDMPGIMAFMEQQVLDLPGYRSKLAELQNDPLLQSFDLLELRDGRYFERNSLPQLLRGSPAGRVFSFKDVTERKRAEQELVVARDSADRANKAKSEFLSQMSHELRTPLNAILGFTQIMQMMGAPEQKENLNHILHAGHHLLDLINEILDLAKIEAGKLSLTLEAVDLSSLLNECLMLVEPIANKQQVKLINRVSANGECVEADRMRTRQMILNLLSNAIKYNRPQGEVILTLDHPQEGQLRLVVEDTGIGMSETDLEKLFQPFSRVGNKQTKVEGTGIGLAFTRKLAHMMKGDVGVSSCVNVGSKFWIDLPAIGNPVLQHVEANRAEKAETFQQRPATVLYVEDDPSSMALMKSVFTLRPAIKLLTAPTAALGLDLAISHNPDVIILDINLPGMSGIELLQHLRTARETSKTPVLALSANALAADIQRGLDAGFDHYLTKPLNIRELIDVLDQTLKSPSANP